MLKKISLYSQKSLTFFKKYDTIIIEKEGKKIMASRKELRERVKKVYLEKLKDFFKDSEDVLQVGSNKIAFPVTDEENNEDFIVIQVSIPTGANKGADVYDGYTEAEAYADKVKAQEEKKREQAEKKAKKIAQDKARREKQKEIAEKKKSK